MKTIPLPTGWRRERTPIIVVGCGGSGSAVLQGLSRLHVALQALGGAGLDVLAVDPDTVSTANLSRQLFTAMDVGSSKAEILITRANMWHGLRWKADCSVLEKRHFPMPSSSVRDGNPLLVIGCVDTPKARASIEALIRQQEHVWWLDLGNARDTGQVLLGEWRIRAPWLEGLDAERLRMHAAPHPPLPSQLFPQLVTGAGDDGPSCSAAEALERQSLFINPTLAQYACNLLWRWHRQGELDHHGYFVNLATGTARPLALDQAMWDRLQKQAAQDAKQAARAAQEAARAAAQDDRQWRRAREQWTHYADRARIGSVSNSCRAPRRK